MIIVTGGAGFIGSNIVHELNQHGIADILVVDHLENAAKFRNLEGAQFTDYMDKREFRAALASSSFEDTKIDAILHQGACSNTLEDDGVYMMDNNFTYSKEVLSFARKKNAPLVYASTAAVYGLSGPGHFTPSAENERPLNVYGFSKLAFDHHVRDKLAKKELKNTVVGLRYFNVYGPRELHKGRMASVMHHFSADIKKNGKVRLFQGSQGYGDGEQRRDFVYVRDIARLNMFFAGLGPYAQNKTKRFQGVVNAGTGESRTFNEVTSALMTVHGAAKIEYVPFPADLIGRYQHFTEADLTGLRELGYDLPFTPLEQGISETFRTQATISMGVRGSAI